MGSATVVATAISLIVIVVLAYFLIGIVFTTNELISAAQNEQAYTHADRLSTSIMIDSTSAPVIESGKYTFYVEIKNDGKTILANYKLWDVIVGTSTGASPTPPTYCLYNQTSKENYWDIVSIAPDLINPRQLNPGETMNITVKVSSTLGMPRNIIVTTPNGISAPAYLHT